MSRSTFPAPTEGSWSASPTKSSLQPGFIALSRLYMRMMSIIDTSSTTTASHSSGLDGPRPKRQPSSPGSNSSSLWIVRDRLPVASAIRLAALPVGAASCTFIFLASNKSMSTLRVVVFPVPGPPVKTITPDTKARSIASR
ncbi:MAG: hypothetical protein BWY85_02308 [Firmicutes bacterium ADurb.Bin506]|nr:MAG: hypothetical protein BWY85_02308 [Firmicutes bacterium ADurb.Bin506]